MTTCTEWGSSSKNINLQCYAGTFVHDMLWHRHTGRMFFYVAFSCRSTNLFSEKSDRPIDTNVLAVKFSLLSEPGHLHTGDAIVCCNEKCAAVLNHLSKLSEVVGKKEKVMFNINVGSML